MSRARIIVIALVVLLIGAFGAWMIFSGEEGEGTEIQNPTFTPPPLSEDPPMGSDDIDRVMREMEERK